MTPVGYLGQILLLQVGPFFVVICFSVYLVDID